MNKFFLSKSLKHTVSILTLIYDHVQQQIKLSKRKKTDIFYLDKCSNKSFRFTVDQIKKVYISLQAYF